MQTLAGEKASLKHQITLEECEHILWSPSTSPTDPTIVLKESQGAVFSVKALKYAWKVLK